MAFSHWTEQFVLRFFRFRRINHFPLIICMHDVENSSGYCSVRQSEFEDLVCQFRSLGFRPGGLTDVLDALYSGSNSPVVHFMFDDGCSGWQKLGHLDFVSFAVSQDSSIYRSTFNPDIFCNTVGKVKIVDHLTSHDTGIYSDINIEEFYTDDTRFEWRDKRVIALPFGGEKELRYIFRELIVKKEFFLTTISRWRLLQIFRANRLTNNNIFPRVSYYSGDTAKDLLNRNDGVTNFMHRIKSWI